MGTYMHEKISDLDQVLKPFGPFTQEQLDAAKAQGATQCEVWCTDFSDPNEYCDFKLLKENGVEVAVERMGGH